MKDIEKNNEAFMALSLVSRRISELETESERIKAENAKLRELVRDLVRWQETEHQPHEELQFWGDKNSGVYARVRELGVEVRR